MFVCHLDMNSLAFRKESAFAFLERAARFGYDAVLYEVEDKVRWKSVSCAHPDAMSKQEFRELVDYGRRLGLEPIPLMQSCGHAEYILMKEEYRHLRENPNQNSCYCTGSAEVRGLLKRFAQEYLELFGDVRYFHLGGDEAWVFGTCAECSKRVPMELYAEHIMEISSAIRARGIRCCVWSDMILHHRGEIAAIPRELMIWDWNYEDGVGRVATADGKTRSPFEGADFLKKNGFDVVLCSAVQSWGDSPFDVRFGMHLANLCGVEKKARQLGLAGTCVTGWSLHNAPKELMTPLYDAASRARRGETLPALRRAIAVEYYQTAPAVLDHLFSWSWECNSLRYLTKDSLLPPRDYLIRAVGQATPAQKAAAREELSSIKKAFAAYCQSAGESDFSRLVRTAIELKIAYCEVVCARLNGDEVGADIPELERRTAALYALDQTPGCAAYRARLLWGNLA